MLRTDKPPGLDEYEMEHGTISRGATMIDVISRTFGVSGRKENPVSRDSRDNSRELIARADKRAGERDLFDLARGIAFRAKKRSLRSSGVV